MPGKAANVTSQAPQGWYVLLKDDAAAGRVIVALKPFFKFSRRIDRQLHRLERRMEKEVPQLLNRQKLSSRRKSSR